MKILVITSAYPSDKDLYSNAFVHSRIKGYKEKLDVEISVIVCRRKVLDKEYIYDDVKVNIMSEKSIKKHLSEQSYDKILVHFLTVPVMHALKDNNISDNVLVWVHGEEALSWKTRLFNLRQPNYVKYFINNIIQLKEYKKFVELNEKIKFIFVSKWMKEQAEKDMKVSFFNYEIIPNGIDTDFYTKKTVSNSETLRILVIRPFTSKKYATDMIVQALEKLSTREDFSKFSITIFGKGRLLNKQLKNLRHYSNVQIHEKFLSKNQIKYEHSRHDVFLCPTRQDAQGVSMCEAMSSGLIPITSDNTAIPEFVEHNVSGILTKSVDELVYYLLQLKNDKKIMEHMGIEARKAIVNKCNKEDILDKEISLIIK